MMAIILLCAIATNTVVCADSAKTNNVDSIRLVLSNRDLSFEDRHKFIRENHKRKIEDMKRMTLDKSRKRKQKTTQRSCVMI